MRSTSIKKKNQKKKKTALHMFFWHSKLQISCWEAKVWAFKDTHVQTLMILYWFYLIHKVLTDAQTEIPSYPWGYIWTISLCFDLQHKPHKIESFLFNSSALKITFTDNALKLKLYKTWKIMKFYTFLPIPSKCWVSIPIYITHIFLISSSIRQPSWKTPS